MTLTPAVTSWMELGQRIKGGKKVNEWIRGVEGGRGGGEMREAEACKRHQSHYIPVESLHGGVISDRGHE